MKIGFISFWLALMAFSMNAQISPHALGLRFSSSNGIQSVGVEVSYQKSLGEQNRIELDLGLSNGSLVDLFRLAGYYHWVKPLEQGFAWYLGPGGGLGIIDYNAPIGELQSDVFIILGGQVGIEYIFADIPLQLALDLRPEFFIGSLNDNVDVDLGFSVRYLF